MKKKSDYSLFINFFFNSLKYRIIHYILGPHYLLFIIFGSLFTNHHKKAIIYLSLYPIQTLKYEIVITVYFIGIIHFLRFELLKSMILKFGTFSYVNSISSPIAEKVHLPLSSGVLSCSNLLDHFGTLSV